MGVGRGDVEATGTRIKTRSEIRVRMGGNGFGDAIRTPSLSERRIAYQPATGGAMWAASPYSALWTDPTGCQDGSTQAEESVSRCAKGKALRSHLRGRGCGDEWWSAVTNVYEGSIAADLWRTGCASSHLLCDPHRPAAAIVRLGWVGVNGAASPAASSPRTARPRRGAARRGRRRLAGEAENRTLPARSGRRGRCGVPRCRRRRVAQVSVWAWRGQH